MPNLRSRCVFRVFLRLCVVNVTWLQNGVPRAKVACDQSPGIREGEDEFFLQVITGS